MSGVCFHDRVLDFGCGTGRLTGLLSRHSPHVIGVDPNPDMVSRARELFDARFAHAPGGALRHPGRSFDLVFASNVLGHVQDLDWQLREIASVIKLGGRLVVVSPNRAFDWFNAPKHWVTEYRSDPTIKYLFTARSMLRLLAIHGFERRRLNMSARNSPAFCLYTRGS